MTAPELAAERVWRTVRSEILDGTRAGGSRLSERALADEYGVSRIPVRTAIRRLRQEGLIDQLDYRRLVVHTMSRADAADLAELLETLDLHAVRLASARRSDQDVEAFWASFAAADRASSQGDAIGASRAGLELRSRIIEASGSRPLQEVENLLDGQFQRLFALTDPLLLAPYPHIRVTVESLAAQEPDRAAQAVRSLLENKRAAQQQRTLDLLQSASRDESRSGLPFEDQTTHHGFTAEPEFLLTVNAVRHQIVHGRRAPGEVISERILANEFGISRIPALQAIEVLAHEGLIALGTSRSPSHVRRIDDREAADVYDLSIVLDLLAIRLATERRSRHELANLHTLLAEELNTDPSDTQERIDRMFAFRTGVFDVSGNRWLREADRIVSSRLRLLVRDAPLTPERLHGHAFLFDAIASRDGALSEAVYRKTFAPPERADA